MTKDELKQWMAESKRVDGQSEFDERGNCDEWRIYERDGQLYRQSFMNGHPCEKWGEKGHIRGVYEPRKVIRETETVEIVRYRQPDERPT